MRRVSVWAALAIGLVAACGLPTEGEAVLSADASDEPSGGGGTGGSVDDASFGGTTADAHSDIAVEAAPEPLPYAFRRKLVIQAGPSGIPAGASIRFRFDHAALVAAQKSRSDGADVRIFYQAPGQMLELNRRLDPTSSWDAATTALWFRAEVPISGTADSSYFVYYGDLAAQAPPEDGNQVFAYWDDFDGAQLGPGWTAGSIGSATGKAEVSGGRLRIQAATGDIWDYSDDFYFVRRYLSGNFVVDTHVISYGGTVTGWSRLGGVMVRAGQADDAKHAAVSPMGGAAAVGVMYRTNKGSYTDGAFILGANPVPEYIRLERVTGTVRTAHSDDGITFVEPGPAVSFSSGLPDELMVGIPFANIASADGFVQVDWFRVRVWVPEEPTVTAEPEEPGPFFP